MSSQSEAAEKAPPLLVATASWSAPLTIVVAAIIEAVAFGVAGARGLGFMGDDHGFEVGPDDGASSNETVVAAPELLRGISILCLGDFGRGPRKQRGRLRLSAEKPFGSRGIRALGNELGIGHGTSFFTPEEPCEGVAATEVTAAETVEAISPGRSEGTPAATARAVVVGVVGVAEVVLVEAA
jgi:hypothetical protein